MDSTQRHYIADCVGRKRTLLDSIYLEIKEMLDLFGLLKTTYRRTPSPPIKYKDWRKPCENRRPWDNHGLGRQNPGGAFPATGRDNAAPSLSRSFPIWTAP
jgi:hypothetical protein